MTAILQWLEQGGTVMWLLLGLSLISWFWLIERGLWLYLFQKKQKRLLQEVSYLESSSEEKETALRNMDTHPLGMAFRDYRDDLAMPQSSAQEAEASLVVKIKKWLATCERGLTTLEVIAAVAPLLGLLGTVIGMVEVFRVIALEGTGDPALLASGISKALNTTVFGLCVAIPAFIGHRFFDRKIEAWSHLIEAASLSVKQSVLRISNTSRGENTRA